ncbi:hypothetical protein B484DRAFT_480177, partial [Ochromonadaceae sp. CCMP2298]
MGMGGMGGGIRGTHSTPQARIAAGVLFPWAFFLLLGLPFKIMSTYIAAVWVVWACFSVFTHSLARRIILRYSAPPPSYLLSPEFFYSLSLIPMLFAWAQTCRYLYTILLPLLGKTGTVVPTDPIVGAITGLLASSPASIILAHELDRPVLTQRARRACFIGMGVTLVYATLYMRPYSAAHPKRLWVQHVERDLSLVPDLSSQQNVRDCGMWVSAFDQLGECYMQFPWYFPVSEVLRESYYIAAECPKVGAARLSLKLHSVPVSSGVHTGTGAGTGAVPDPVSSGPVSIPHPLVPSMVNPKGEGLGSDLRLLEVTVRGPSHMHLVLRDGDGGGRLLRWYIDSRSDLKRRHRGGEG